jgi:plasmid stabilization system protein ParE
LGPIRQSRRAQIDIEKIFEQSLNTGAEAATEAYLACLLRAIGLLQHYPELGFQVEGNPLLRCLVHREHAVYYRIDPSNITILRVLDIRHFSASGVES